MDKIKSHRDLNVYQLSSKAGNKLITETIAGMCGNARQPDERLVQKVDEGKEVFC